MSGVAANLEVGDEDAEDGDADEARDGQDVDPPIDRMPAAEAREGEHAERAADEPSDVAAERDVVQREAEREVQDDDDERGAAEDVDAMPLEYEAGSEDPED